MITGVQDIYYSVTDTSKAKFNEPIRATKILCPHSETANQGNFPVADKSNKLEFIRGNSSFFPS